MSKRIFFLFNAFVSVSGGDIRFIEIAKRLARKDVEMWVITPKLGKEICEVHGLNAKYILTTTEDRVKNVIYTYLRRITRALFLELKMENNTILWSTSDFLPDVIPAFFLKRKNPRVIWLASIYHLIPDPSIRPGHLKLSNVLSYVGQQVSIFMIREWANLIQTETCFLKSKLIKEYKIPSERIIAIQSGVDTKVVDKVSLSNEKMYDACFIARLHPSKGIFDLIKAWKYIHEEHKKDVKLAIAGGGPIEMLDKLKSMIQSLGLERNIAILGFLSEEKKYKLLKSSKLYVLPSYEEGIPITFYEAMYCGLPVITYYLPTYEEIKDYIVSVPLGNVRKLAEEIIRLLEDENLTLKLGEKGRKFAKERTWDKVAECIISQLEKLG